MLDKLRKVSLKTWLITLVASVFLIASGVVGYAYLTHHGGKIEDTFTWVDGKKHEEKKTIANAQSKEVSDVAKKNKEDQPYLHEKLSNLKGTNNEAVGFVYIPGSKLEEPIVQGTDNETYLTKTFEGANVPFLGSVFLDANNNRNFGDRLTWLFGHARGSKVGDHRMFNDVNYYADQNYLNTHKYVVVETNDRKLYYEVAFMTIVPEETSFYRTEFIDDIDFQEQLDALRGQARTVNSNVKLDAKDKYLVLSTCREEDDTLRANVYCRLIPDDELMSVLEAQGSALDYKPTR